MKKKEAEAIGRRLSLNFPEIIVKGDLAFIKPLDHILRGVCFNGSIDPRSFYVEIFIQPLFIPLQHLAFNIGWRLRNPTTGMDSWNADDLSLTTDLIYIFKHDVLPFFSNVHSPQDVANIANSVHKINGFTKQNDISYISHDAFTQQAIAYSLARAGNIEQAIVALNRLVNLLSTNITWQCEIAKRALTLKTLLLNDLEGAQQQLDAWEAETIKNLGLEKY